MPIIRLTNFTCLYGRLAPGRFGSLTIHSSTKGLGAFSIFFFSRDEKCETKKELIFSTGKCESVLSTFSIPLYQNDQKGRQACFLFPCSISFISAPLVVTYVEERFGILYRMKRRQGSSSQQCFSRLHSPPFKSQAPLAWAKMGIRNKD